MAVMTTSERAALLTELASHPEIKKRYPQFWRVKRLEGDHLRHLAISVGIDAESIHRRISQAHARASADSIAKYRSQPPPARPAAPFTGTFGFILNIEAFGLNTPRRARVVWEYTPEWPYFPPQGNLRFDGHESASFIVEVETVTQEEPIELPDGTEEPVTVFEWQPLVLWGAGLVGDNVVDHIFERIEEAAKAQNRARKRARSRATVPRAKA
jgi:hypothetical protein